jgi:hypothetical protein
VRRQCQVHELIKEADSPVFRKVETCCKALSALLLRVPAWTMGRCLEAEEVRGGSGIHRAGSMHEAPNVG